MNEALGPKISPNFSTSLPSFSLTSNLKFAALLILANPKAITIYLDENHLQHLPQEAGFTPNTIMRGGGVMGWKTISFFSFRKFFSSFT